MSSFKKYMVVPYVNSIEKPVDSFVENADRNMSDIITDSKMPDDLKIKLYHQNLNKFLLKYDPESYGVTPTLVKLSKIVSAFIENKNENKLEEPPLDATLKVEPKFDSLFSSKTPLQDNNFHLDYKFHEPGYYDTDKDLYKITSDDSINRTVNSSILDSSENLDETDKTLNNSYINKYEASTNPAANTRSNSNPTHHQGEYGDVKIYKPTEIKESLKEKNNSKFFIASNPKVLHSPFKNGAGQEWATTKANKFF